MSDTRELARGRWPEILTKLGAEGSALDGKHRPCPSCGGKDRFRYDDKDGRGTHICSQCGAGDGFELLQKMHGCTFKEAVRMVEESLGIDGSNPPSREQQQTYRRKLDAERRKREQHEAEAHRLAAIEAQDQFNAAQPADLNHPYLIAKGIQQLHGDIRQKGDTLIVPVRINGEITTLQFISPDGSKRFLKGGAIIGGGCVLPGEPS